MHNPRPGFSTRQDVEQDRALAALEKQRKKEALEELPRGLPTKSSVVKGARSQVKSPPKGSKKLFNLKGVAEILIEHGLNPVEEILRVRHDLDPETQAKLMAEILQYVQPKLRSVEVNATIRQVMTEEERLLRIAELKAKMDGSRGS